jgi:hypothetical protein
VIVDGKPPGHVSIGPNVPAAKVKGAIVDTLPKDTSLWAKILKKIF